MLLSLPLSLLLLLLPSLLLRAYAVMYTALLPNTHGADYSQPL
jgi:hypothetical protein